MTASVSVPPNQCVTCGRLDCPINFDGVNLHRPSRTAQRVVASLRTLVALLAAVLLLSGGTTPAKALPAGYFEVIHGTYVHSDASTRVSTRIATVPAESYIHVSCWYLSTYWGINGDLYWYLTSWHGYNGQIVTGWISGWRLATGLDPNPTVRHCVHGIDYGTMTKSPA